GAKLTKVSCERCDLRAASLHGAEIHASTFDNALAAKADFTAARIIDSSLRGAKLSMASFRQAAARADYTGANFQAATNTASAGFAGAVGAPRNLIVPIG
ncbi:hypothetical protein EMIHUDRAFT_244116, partial [Emiliania huxleyi CCMP1516]